MPTAVGRIRPSIKKGLFYTYEVSGELSDAGGGVPSIAEAAAIIIAQAQAEPWGAGITNVNIVISAPDPTEAP